MLRTARWPVAAPGGEGETSAADCATGGRPKGVLSTYWIDGERDQYACLAGTSMAAPHVSGALAILRGQGLGPQAAVDRLLGTARDLGDAGRDPSFGVGLIDLAAAAGPGPDPTTSSAVASTTRGTAAPGTTGATVPPTTTPTVAPPDTLPSTEQAAPFTGRSQTTEDPGGWLVGVAIALLTAASVATASVAWRLSGRVR